MQDTIQKTFDSIGNSATFKALVIGFLIVILLVPVAMISMLAGERQARRDSVIREINAKWGESQVVTGPYMTVPFKSFYKDENDTVQYSLKYLHILPENLHVSGVMEPHIRYRSIYEAVLYNALTDIRGTFRLPVQFGNINTDDIIWEESRLSVGITDMRGIKDTIDITWNGEDFEASPGLPTADIASSGVQWPVPVTPGEQEYSFSLKLNLNGSEQLHFIPAGKTNTVRIESPWPSPSFNGSFLPAAREISDSGFSADWSVLQLNRNYPQYWEGDRYDVGDSSFGLSLVVSADIYQKSMRISKYAIMFIVFTFSAFFLSDIINKQRIHPIQYVLIGVAVILFFILLLSMSEHIMFDLAYAVSALAVSFLITAYSQGVFGNRKFSLSVFGLLSALYAYLYIVLQLEDYALLMGSIGLLLVLAAVMYITRNVDWFTIGTKNNMPS